MGFFYYILHLLFTSTFSEPFLSWVSEPAQSPTVAKKVQITFFLEINAIVMSFITVHVSIQISYVYKKPM